MKEKLIYWLGGVPADEARKSYANSGQLGAAAMLERIIGFARELNGKDPQEWCNEMWQYLMAQRKALYGKK